MAKKRYEKKLEMMKAELGIWEDMMQQKCLNYKEMGIKENNTKFLDSVKFRNGVQMDFYLCSGKNGDPLWCEVKLNDHGSSVSRQKGQKLQGKEWRFEYSNSVYVVSVIGILSIQELRTGVAKMSQSQFAAHFGIPIRTLQHWEQGDQKPPSYVVHMIGRILNLEAELKAAKE